MALPFIRSLIDDGSYTLLWLDYWHPHGVLVLAYGERIRADSGRNKLAPMSSILVDGVWCTGSASSSQLAQEWAALPSIPCRPPGSGDMAFWSASSNGLFATVSAWETVRSKYLKVARFDTVWFHGHIPRHRFTLWRAMTLSLLTSSLLHDRGIIPNYNCGLCWAAKEDIKHLFFFVAPPLA